jgi:hypothetical protein
MKLRHKIPRNRMNYLFQLNMERNLLEVFDENLLGDNLRVDDEVLFHENLSQDQVEVIRDESLCCYCCRHSFVEEDRV